MAFPSRGVHGDEYEKSRLWTSLNRLGVGAIPLLPESTDYLEHWLSRTLKRGGWALAERAVAHRSNVRAADWRIAAAQPVLVGVLRPQNAGLHLAWISEKRLYYMPFLRGQRRQYNAAWVALYSPMQLREPGAVTHRARVRSVHVVNRGEIPTPWAGHQQLESPQVLFHLEALEQLTRPIESATEGRAHFRFSTHRWTSRLALERASTLPELLLETEPEWKLYEDLQANRLTFWLNPGPAVLPNLDDPVGRVWFEFENDRRVRYEGTAGFHMRAPDHEDRFVARLDDLLAALGHGR